MQFDPSDYDAFQASIDEDLREHGATWGIGGYLQERATLLRHYPQMIQEGRVYHLGLDVSSPPDTPVFAPIDGTVIEASKEDGVGNYGGYIVMRHHIHDVVFHSIYGHLRTPHMVKPGDALRAGDQFALLGKGSDSGGWFSHVHIQLLTERAMQEGWLHKGYCTKEQCAIMDELCPDPTVLFRMK
jgi:murein DD-endopeptidase MepM/ murein hydrolase activator NlpD